MHAPALTQHSRGIRPQPPAGSRTRRSPAVAWTTRWLSAALFCFSLIPLGLAIVAGTQPGLAWRVNGSRLEAALPAARAGPAPLSREAVATVMAYVDTLRPEDSLVEVRPGVLAKRSNVHGVALGEPLISSDHSSRTVYYDIFPHQSFGPLASGHWRESDVTVFARETRGTALVLVYTPSRERPGGPQ